MTGTKDTERTFRTATSTFREKGYEWAASQVQLFEGTDGCPVVLCDLFSLRNPRPLIRVFVANEKILSSVTLEAAREKARSASISLITFTHDGKTFTTCLASGNGGSLPYLPKSPLRADDAVRHIRRIEDAFPFTSILELRRLVGRLADSLYTASGNDRLQLFDTALLLLAMKFHDEINHPQHLRLPTILTERNPQALLTAFCRSALKAFGVGHFMPQVRFDDPSTVAALRSLLPFSFRQSIQLGVQAEILGTFYQEIVSSTFRGSLGAYFTPKPVADLATSLCEPKEDDTIFDVSCGSGTFLLLICA